MNEAPCVDLISVLGRHGCSEEQEGLWPWTAKKKATRTEERGNRSQITRPLIKDSKDSKCEGKVLKTSEQRITRSNLLTGITCLLYQEKKQKELIAIISTLQ